jgi:hypothetical protein
VVLQVTSIRKLHVRVLSRRERKRKEEREENGKMAAPRDVFLEKFEIIASVSQVSVTRTFYCSLADIAGLTLHPSFCQNSKTSKTTRMETKLTTIQEAIDDFGVPNIYTIRGLVQCSSGINNQTGFLIPQLLRSQSVTMEVRSRDLHVQ